MEVSNKKTTIILIVGIAIILGAFFIYRNIDKIKNFLNYEETPKVQKEIPNKKENKKSEEETEINEESQEEIPQDVYECPFGYSSDEELTGNTICYKYINLTSDGYSCPEGTYSEDSFVNWSTKCYASNETAPNACPNFAYNDGTRCVQNEASKLFDKSSCLLLNGVWKEDGCHSTSSYICPDGTETRIHGFDPITCVKVFKSVENFHCSEGTYDSATNKCVLSANTIKKDI